MRPEAQWQAFLTIIRKELVRIVRIWTQTFIPPVIRMALYFLIFGRIVGRHIPPIEGFAYVQYISSGLIMMSVLLAAYMNSSSSFFGAKFSRCIEEMLMSPMPNYIILLGYVFASVLRALIVGVLVTLVSLFFTHLRVHHWLIFLSTVIMASFLFALLGLLNGILAKKFDDVMWIPEFVITPLLYFSGVFFSVQSLPGLWSKLVMFDPLYYIVASFRYGMLGLKTMNMGLALTILFGASAIFYLLVLRMLAKSSGLRQ